MIPDELIEQIRDAADVVGIIGESVPLKRSGADWRGACPFHGGTHRNFAVIPKKGIYYCYVCHAGGDVFTYLMKHFGMDYPTAVRDVARRVGIAVPDQAARQGPDPREPLFSAVAVAQEWFAARLREAADAEGARRYLESRDLPLAQAAELGLGYAPKDGSFRAAMTALGIDEPVLLEAGLLVRREDGTVAPRFRARLVFPIHDLRGRPVAFGGRLLGPGEPKYLNSPESPVFHKGSTLYHLHAARQAIRREGVVVLVEGYFDVIRPVLAGIEHIVAPLGTALTTEQAALLKRYASSAILLYDSDTAGLRASFRAGDELLRHGVRIRVATLPAGEDPDSLVRSGGAAALEQILSDAVDVLERKIQLLERKGWFADVERRRDALDRLLPTVRAAQDPIAQDLYLGRVAEVTGVSKAVLARELAARRTPEPAPGRPPHAPPPDRERIARRRREGARIEAKLLQVLLNDAVWLDRARTSVSPERFEVPAFREIFTALVAVAPGEPALSAAESLSPAAAEVWDRLVRSAEQLGAIDWDAEYAGAVQSLNDREQLRSLPPVDDVAARREGLQQLSPEARVRLSWLKQASAGRTRVTNARVEGTDHAR